MYTISRHEAADILSVSVRSIDRYVKSGKLRVQKDGKNILIHKDDIQALKTPTSIPKQHVVVEDRNYQNQYNNYQEPVQRSNFSQDVSTKKEEAQLSHIYEDLKKDITKKDELIQTLAIRVGKAEEIAKNSISVHDFKKSQLLLEESKSVMSNELTDLKKEKQTLTESLKYEKQVKILLLIVSLILFCTLLFVWVSGI